MLNKKGFLFILFTFLAVLTSSGQLPPHIHTIHLGEWIITENNTVYFARPQRSYVVCDLEWSL